MDLEKAFDRVPRDLIWAALRWHRVPELYIKLIMDMYDNACTKIKCMSGVSDSFFVTIGVHQGAVLSPLLFNIVMNYLMQDLMDDVLLVLQFADDYALIDEDIVRLQTALDRWLRKMESNGLRISREKSEYLHLPFSHADSPTPDFTLDGTMIPKCKSFKYLGSVVNQSGNCDDDVNHRISVAWLRWKENSSIFCDPRIPVKLKGKLYSTVIYPTIAYGSKCWTLYNKHLKQLTATEMKMLRISSGVTKLDKLKSDHIRGSMHIKAPVVEKIKMERVNWFEKLHSDDDDHLVKRTMNINIPAVTRRGAPKQSWTRQMHKRQKDYGLNQEEKNAREEIRRRLRSHNSQP